MVVTSRPYEKGDIEKLRLREPDKLGGSIPEPESNEAWTLEVGSQPIVCCGIEEVEKGIGLLWALITDDARGHGISLVRFGRSMVRYAMEIKGMHRVYSSVRADDDEYVRFTEMLGLDREGLMRKVAEDKTDMWLMAKVEE